MVYVYGVHHFRKMKGHIGGAVTCPDCKTTYQRQVIRDAKWGHFDYIPLIPLGTDYYVVCPVCYAGELATKDRKKEIKSLLAQNTPAYQKLTPHLICHADGKTYDLILQDDVSGQRYVVETDATKAQIKKVCKDRFYKKDAIVYENQ